jgi:hypothetical protein
MILQGNWNASLHGSSSPITDSDEPYGRQPIKSPSRIICADAPSRHECTAS